MNNNILYDMLLSKRPPAAVKAIRYRVRRVVNKGVVKWISTQIEEPTEEPQPSYDFYR